MRYLLPAFVCMILANLALADDQKIADFTLPDAAGKAVRLSDFAERKAIAVIFVGTECPLNNAYMPRLVELSKEFAGVQFLAINANHQDSAARIAAHAKEHGLPFPVLKDDGQVVADRFTAVRTPEAFVLDAARVVRYHGRIDDQFGIGFKRPKATRRDLAEALTEVLAGKEVSQPAVTASGCIIGRDPKPRPTATVTYSKHVAVILQKRCQECHRAGQIGPMPLVGFDVARSWSATIREVVTEKRMPPWHADPRHGAFANDRSLTQAETDTLLAWIDQGCAEGNPADLPAKKEWPTDWIIGKPDVVFEMDREFRVPAEAKGGIRYQYFTVSTQFAEDRWIQAAEARPGNRAVVHHIIVYIRKPGQPRNRADGIGDGFLTGYAPGDQPLSLPAGTAKLIPKGASLIFQMHYTPNGTEQVDRSQVGLIFAKAPPQQAARTRAIAQQLLFIPPKTDDHKATSRTTFTEDALLLSFQPHMHLRGKSFEYQAVFPDGKRTVLLSVPRFDFNWQSHYQLAKPLHLPAGTRIECTAHFDNSASNLNNPDPNKWVRWGDQTWEEMMIGFVDYVNLGEKR